MMKVTTRSCTSCVIISFNCPQCISRILIYLISFRDIPREDRAESTSRGLDYLHTKGNLRPWMRRRFFDSQDKSIPGMRCSARSGETHLKERGQMCHHEPVEFSEDQTSLMSLLPPKIRRTTCSSDFRAGMGGNIYELLHSVKSRPNKRVEVEVE